MKTKSEAIDHDHHAQADEIRILAAQLPVALRHELLDLDADSTCCPAGFTCPNVLPAPEATT